MSPHRTFVGTFGFAHSRTGKFVLFTAEDEADANARMFAAYGRDWSMAREITADDPDPAGIERWGLVEIEFGS